jgi:hypothetical protein
MKELVTKEVENTDFQKNAELAKAQIDQTLRNIHKRMSKVFHIDFAYFSDVKIIKCSEIQNELAQRTWNDLEESGVVQSSTQWNQTFETLLKNPTAEIFEYFAFYSPRDDTLYINEKMLTAPPEKIVSVCAHELAEKLLSRYTSSPMKSFVQPAVKLYLEAKKTNNTKRLHELLNIYINTVFKIVFKEGCCEAIALKTLSSMGYETEVTSLEKELREGYTKCIGLLSYIENTKTSGEKRREASDVEKLTIEVLRSSQIIKGVAYYLGYPLAKTVLVNYGIEGIWFAIENNPPLKAQYFANPRTYLPLLKKTKISNQTEEVR